MLENLPHTGEVTHMTKCIQYAVAAYLDEADRVFNAHVFQGKAVTECPSQQAGESILSALSAVT